MALDILSDGTTRQYPGYELRFARIALRLVRLPDPEVCARLASVYHEDLEASYAEALQDRLGQSSVWSQLGAWHLLTSLADREVLWAVRMLGSRWPADIEAQKFILLGSGPRVPSKWAVAKAGELAPKIEPSWVFQYFGRWRFRDSSVLEVPEPLGTVIRLVYEPGKRCEVAIRSMWNELIARLLLTPCHLGNELWKALKAINVQNNHWFPFVCGARFGANPSAKTLAAELEWLAECWEPSDEVWLPSLPWPLAACLNQAKSKEDLLHLATAAKQGRLGDSKHWNAAEKRWKENGVVEEDFLATSSDQLPLRPEFATIGFPFSVSGWGTSGEYRSVSLTASMEKLRQIGNTETRSWLAGVILSVQTFPPSRRRFLSPTEFRELYLMASQAKRPEWRRYWLGDSLAASVPSGPLSVEWVEFLNWAGREVQWFPPDTASAGLAEELSHHFCSNPEGYRGLFAIIAGLAVAGYRCVLPQHVIDLAKSWGSGPKDDAIGLSLARGDLSTPEIIALAEEISNSDSLDTAAWRALKMASGLSLKQAAEFAIALLGLLNDKSRCEVEAANDAREILNQFVTKRPSVLQDPTVWERLKLPERV